MPYSLADVRGAVARGWCHPTTETKEMDVTLAEAISQEVWKMLHQIPEHEFWFNSSAKNPGSKPTQETEK